MSGREGQRKLSFSLDNIMEGKNEDVDPSEKFTKEGQNADLNSSGFDYLQSVITSELNMKDEIDEITNSLTSSNSETWNDSSLLKYQHSTPSSGRTSSNMRRYNDRGRSSIITSPSQRMKESRLGNRRVSELKSSLNDSTSSERGNSNRHSTLGSLPYFTPSERLSDRSNQKLSDRSNNTTESSLRSALRHGPISNQKVVNFAGNITTGDYDQRSPINFGGHNSETSNSEDSMDMAFIQNPNGSFDDYEDSNASEMFFLDPKQRASRQANISSSNGRRAESLAVELRDLEQYLGALRESIKVTKKTLNDGSSMTHNKRNIPQQFTTDSHPPNSERPMPKENPKSRRRFSMAHRTAEEVVTYPDDCFSFLILHGPIKSPRFFFFALGISLLQLSFLILALLSMVHPDWSTTASTDNPTSTFFWFLPSNVSSLVRITQMMAIISYCLFADMSVKDYLTALDLFPQYSKLTKGDKYGCMVFSCFLRFIMGFLSAVVTIIMLLTSTDVVDTILDFLAMNFISDLGKMAFQLALWGKYGRRLEAEARRLEEMPMPDCMLRDQNRRRNCILLSPIIILALFFLLLVIGLQESDMNWSTRTIRVQINDNPSLEPYSGCYAPKDNRTRFFPFADRIKYDAFSNNSIQFGYCNAKNQQQWILYNTELGDPCKLRSEDQLLRSTQTITYDISASFSSTWIDKHGNSVDLRFFQGEDNSKTCHLFLNDGFCDSTFNNIDNNYDGGDCCASSCTKSNCGVRGLVSAFGTDGIYGDGFPNCVDPSMVPITIKLDNIFDSQLQSLPRRMENSSVIEPIIMLDCDNRNVLKVRVNENMASQIETVYVEDGASCTIRINNSTSSTVSGDIPIWHVNYTVYHGVKKTVDSDSIVILREQSVNNEYANFERIPECYFDKLSDYLDNTTMYTGTSPENRAIKWLRMESHFSRNSVCEDDYFIERYALSVLNFAAPIQLPPRDDPNFEDFEIVPDINFGIGDASIQETRRMYYENFLWIEETRQCIWPSVNCNQRSVESLDLHSLKLDGTVASSIGMLTNLAKLGVSDNNLIGAIPSEIGLLGSLKTLDFEINSLSGTIPTEIGEMTSLEVLNAAENDLGGTIPSEIGLMTAMKTLNLAGNSLTLTIPSEIGTMIALEVLDLSNNALSGSIPTEIGKLALSYNLTKVYVGNNLALVMQGDPRAGLRDIVHSECPTESCLPRSDSINGPTGSPCRQLLEAYRQQDQQLPVDDCERLRTECLNCSL